MRTPLEYGDNFPVPMGHWNPAEPWRFPRHESFSSRRGLLGYVLPWITLGLGVTLGILWMNWRLGLVETRPKADLHAPSASRPAHFQMRSDLA